jgi:signal transduction histidine kinase
MIYPRRRIQHRLMLAFATFTLAVSALFGFFAMAFVYTVEDKFMERSLEQEATLQRAHFANHRDWTKPSAQFITLHRDRASLPNDLVDSLTTTPKQREFSGNEGRHYHVLNLVKAGEAPWLVAEVSQQLIVRPIMPRLLRWLATWGLIMVALSLGLSWWLARRTSAPLERLAARILVATPESLPKRLAEGTRNDEVGALARGFDALLARTRDFIEREQEFTRDVSHELRTPLSVLRVSIERLQSDKSESANTSTQLASMLAATVLMEQTVNTLLSLARESKRETSQPVAILPLVERWIVSHADWLDQQPLRIDLRLSPKDEIALPESVLQLALANLLVNAFSHGTANGKVIVQMQAGELAICNPAGTIPDDAGDAFVKREGSSGFGLGLSIVRRLIERQGARIAITHADGWTCVRIAGVPAPWGNAD